MAFNTCNSRTPDFFIKHREHFDAALINLLERLTFQIGNLKSEREIMIANKHRLDYKIINLRNLAKQLKADNYSLKKKYEFDKDNTLEIIKEQEKKIRELDKTINDELNIARKTNVTIQEELYYKKKENEELKKRIEELERENAKYTKSSKTNSKNSSMPPSVDTFSSNIKPDNKRSTKKQGGQPGHDAHIIEVRENPTNIIEKKVVKAPVGAKAIVDENNNILYYVTQEIDLEVNTIITETRYYIDSAGEALNQSIINKYRISCVTYSDNFKAIVLYLYDKATIPFDRLTVVLNELSNNKLHLKPSTVCSWVSMFNVLAQPVIEKLLNSLLEGSLIYCDESGWKINGVNAWVHNISNEQISIFMASFKRSCLEHGPLSVLEDYDGYLVHDHFKPYYKHLPLVTHCECNAHIDRYLDKAIDDEDHLPSAEIKLLLKKMRSDKDDLIINSIYYMNENVIQEFRDKYLNIIANALKKYNKENPNMPNKYKPSWVNLFKRLEKYIDEHLRFIVDFNVPYSNNHAERQIRFLKARKKISGQSKSLKTAQEYMSLRTIIQTSNLQKKNSLEVIKAILNGDTNVFS